MSGNKTTNTNNTYNPIGGTELNTQGGIPVSDVNAPPTTNQNIDITNFLQHANHPFIVFFTIFFKAVAIVSFLFLNIFVNNEALVFIIVVIFSAFDFWFVKNVSGR